jgi:hypothetical protein
METLPFPLPAGKHSTAEPSIQLPVASIVFRVTPRHSPAENTVFFCQECVFIGPLPINECPTVDSICFWNVFTEPFPSNWHMRHNVYLLVKFSAKTVNMCACAVDVRILFALRQRNKLTQEVMLLAGTGMVSFSNIGQDTGYPDLYVVFVSPSRQILNSTLN